MAESIEESSWLEIENCATPQSSPANESDRTASLQEMLLWFGSYTFWVRAGEAKITELVSIIGA